MIEVLSTIVIIPIYNSKYEIIMLDDLALFVHIVKTGSLGKAAQTLSVPPATVTRRLQKLEHQFKCKLINRSARQFNLTFEGQKLFDECAYLIESLEERTNLFETSINKLAGKIKLLAPINLTVDTLAKAWSNFMSQYPDIELEFVLNNKPEDLIATQADFAIRIGPQQDSDLTQIRIGTVRTVLVASPSYIEHAGCPNVPEELSQHHFVVGSTLQDWPLQNQQNKSQFQFRPTTPKVSVNELRLVRLLTIDGQGISLLPVNEVSSALNSGQLIHVMPHWSGHDRNIYILWASDKRLTRRAKLLIEYLKSYVANVPSLQGAVLS
jgi:LysR family transcriptional regulator AphB